MNHFEETEDDESDYFSCVSDCEEGYDFDEEENNSQFSLTPANTHDSSIEEIANQDEENFKPISINITKDVEPEKIRSPIDITFATKSLKKFLKKSESTHTPLRLKEEKPVDIPIINQLKQRIEASHNNFNNPIAPIITKNDPFFEINKRYDYNLFLSDHIQKNSRIQQNPLISRFFPFGEATQSMIKEEPLRQQHVNNNYQYYHHNPNQNHHHSHQPQNSFGNVTSQGTYAYYTPSNFNQSQRSSLRSPQYQNQYYQAHNYNNNITNHSSV